jgi:hypothetical protein
MNARRRTTVAEVFRDWCIRKLSVPDENIGMP